MMTIATILCMAFVLAFGVLGVVYFGTVSFKEFQDLISEHKSHHLHGAL
jgi:hypothetical protein